MHQKYLTGHLKSKNINLEHDFSKATYKDSIFV